MNRYYLTAEQTGQRDVAPRPYFVEDRGDHSWLDHEHLSWQEGMWPEEEYGPVAYRGPVARDYPASDLYGDYTGERRRKARLGGHHDWTDHEWSGQILREFFDWGEHQWRTRSGRGGTPAADHRGKGPKNYRRPDESITEEICERLTDDPLIDASDIRVASRDGHVRLTGCVDSRAIKHRVEDVVADCPGVTAIRNELRLHARGTEIDRRPDESITEEICERLTDDPLIDASDIRVTSRDGLVRLTGCVDERVIKHRVEDIVADCAGVTAIRNELRVDRLHPRGMEDTDNPLRR